MEAPEVLISSKGKIFSRQEFWPPLRRNLDYHHIARRALGLPITYDREIDTSAVVISGNKDI